MPIQTVAWTAIGQPCREAHLGYQILCPLLWGQYMLLATVGRSLKVASRCSVALGFRVEALWRQQTAFRAQISASSSVRKIHRRALSHRPMVDLCGARLRAPRNGVADSTHCLEPQPGRLPSPWQLGRWPLNSITLAARLAHGAPLSEVNCWYCFRCLSAHPSTDQLDTIGVLHLQNNIHINKIQAVQDSFLHCLVSLFRLFHY